MHPTLKAAPARVSAITPEAELVSRAASGDGAAFEVLMRRHNQLLFRTARSILSSYDEAEDAVQEAYLRAWRALSSYRAESRLSTWLVRIVTNKALGRLRRTGAQVIPLEAAMTTPEPRDQDVLTDAPDREQSLLRAQIRKMVEARIDLLPEAYRTVFMLRGRGDERRGSRSGAGHSRAHGAQPLLPRPQSLARKPCQRHGYRPRRSLRLRWGALRPRRRKCAREGQDRRSGANASTLPGPVQHRDERVTDAMG
jgi:RNA polymerase sigma factor (sigma-70 family)